LIQNYLIQDTREKFLGLSGGKNSLTLFLMNPHKYDFVVHCDTSREFPEIEELIQELDFAFPEITIWTFRFEDYEKWKNGLVTRGKNKGKIRGIPLKYFPCWLHREAKAKVFKIFEKCENFVGYTKEEKSRNVKGSKAPLRDSGISDNDCLNFLFRNGWLRNIHLMYNRTGCFDCPKQSDEMLARAKILHKELFQEVTA